jgi:hypothetical protein
MCQLLNHTHIFLIYIKCKCNLNVFRLKPVANDSLSLKYSPTATTAGTYTNPKPIPTNSP